MMAKAVLFLNVARTSRMSFDEAVVFILSGDLLPIVGLLFLLVRWHR